MKTEIPKEQIYKQVLEFISDARGSGQGILYYFSVSCCFGFYTQGMSTFRQVVSGLRDLAAHGTHLDMRVLLEFDNQPIDRFALLTFHRNIGSRVFAKKFRRLKDETASEISHDNGFGIFPDCQFYIVGVPGEERLLVTQEMSKKFDDVLNHHINEIASGTLYDGPEYRELIEKHKRFFCEVWSRSETPIVSGSLGLVLAPDCSVLELLTSLRALRLTMMLRLVAILSTIISVAFSFGLGVGKYLEQIWTSPK